MEYRAWDGSDLTTTDECGIPSPQGPKASPDVQDAAILFATFVVRPEIAAANIGNMGGPSAVKGVMPSAETPNQGMWANWLQGEVGLYLPSDQALPQEVREQVVIPVPEPAIIERIQSLAQDGRATGEGTIADKMASLRKEATLQGVTSVKVWGCTQACYSKPFLEAGGADVEGTQSVITTLPFYTEYKSNASLRTLAKAIDRAFNLACAANFHSRQAIGHSHAKVVVAVHAPNCFVRIRNAGAQVFDEVAIELGHGVAHGVRHVNRGGAFFNHRFNHAAQKIRVTAVPVFG